ncbi:MAG: 16S rRNA (uracil(1498)-N(3))-methyltransferase [Candidatus Obscuribacterales bacterium]|nr:16S rRNA (uracil(1498)-N(3))-methyltransferase [Candidatus Obscuribacterales bacterium]
MTEHPLSKSLSRFFVDPVLVDKAARRARIVDLQQIKQISNVLRLSVGSHIVILDGKGLVARCLITELSKKQVLLDIIEELEAIAEAPVSVTVAMPLLRGGRFDWALQKMTELGVHQVTPIICARSVVTVDLRNEKDKKEKLDRWTAIAREAAEQCERSIVPEIRSPIAFADLMAPSAVSDEMWNLKVICAERSDGTLLSHVLLTLLNEGNGHQISHALPMNILVVVGPEGGFTDEEIESADQAGFQLVSLGPRILRSETASVYALAQVITILGDIE